MIDWLDIETAPKDGTEILAVEDGNYSVCHWDGEQWRDIGDIGAAGMYEFSPTHWAPLQAP